MTTTNSQISIARDAIDHGCDGPITPFVLMVRAAEYSARNPARAEAAANALYEALTEFGWLSDPDALVETGS